MENMVLGVIDQEMEFGVFCFSAIVCLGLSFLIVCVVRPLGNKLLMLGVLLAMTGSVFAATMAEKVAALAVIMLVISAILILVGTVCSLITHFSRSRKADSELREDSVAGH